MSKTSNQTQLLYPNKKLGIFGYFGLYLIRILTNFFWNIVDILSFKSQKIAAQYSISIGKEYLSEYKSLGISQGKKILHIGCGPYPLTEVSLAQQFDAQVVGIDKNKNIIKMAQEVVNNNFLQDKISIKYANGIDYSMENFDVIIISSCAFPKNKILENIIHHAKKGCIIILRELDIAMDDIKSTINKHKNIEIIKQSHHHPLPFVLVIPWTSICLQIK